MDPSKHETALFPRNFSLYYDHAFSSDLYIGTSSATPLYYISHHLGWSGNSDVVLHSGPHKQCPPIATAEFYNSTTKISLDPTSGAIETKLIRSGLLHIVYSFQMQVLNGQVEYFDWKRSGGQEVDGLEGKRRGMKCVRRGDGVVVAAYCDAKYSLGKRGKFGFVGGHEWGGLGERGELVVVVTMLAIVEKIRRQGNANSAA